MVVADWPLVLVSADPTGDWVVVDVVELVVGLVRWPATATVVVVV